MIVVVEGPTAAGKSTWVGAHAGRGRVPEETVAAPDPASSDAELAVYWTELSCRRWQNALRMETANGFAAVCDGDPFKLHYSYGLLRLGHVTVERFAAEIAAARSAIAGSRLGVADLVLCSIPSQSTLARHRDDDVGRRRRNFALHRQLAGPLEEWYQALEATDPGRVIWGFPRDLPPAVSRPRYDVDLFYDWMARLPISN